MIFRLLAKWLPDPGGERRVAMAMAVVALVGAIVASRAQEHLTGTLQVEGGYHLWVILAGMLGAPAGLAIAVHNHGHRGAAGLARLVWGIVSGSFIAALIGGSLALPIYGTMFGPMLLGLVFAASPWLALLWLGAFVLTHRAMADWRRERESIFHWQPAA